MLCGGWLALAALSAAGEEIAFCDGRGMIEALSYEGELLDVDMDVRVALPGWRSFGGVAPWSARDFRFSERDGRKEWVGRIVVEADRTCLCKVVLATTNGAAHVDVSVTAETTFDLEGVYFYFRAPIHVFRNGQARLLDENGLVKEALLPASLPPDFRFLSAPARSAVLTEANGNRAVELAFDQPGTLVMQDDRQWKDPMYSVYTRFHGGNLRQGQTASLGVTVRPTGRGDHSRATLTLDPGAPRYTLDGFGGNFVYGIESPVAQYMLKNLRVAWARTEMTLSEWEPVNDNDSPNSVNWPALEPRDKPGVNLHQEFLIARQIQQKKIPYIISIWRLPEWMYAGPAKDRNGPQRKIARDKWPEVMESIGAYLLYAKRMYGVEPDLFSFNEADSGVMVWLTPEEHRDAIRRLGAYLVKLGLKTRMLLGDTGSPRGSLGFVRPATEDADTMRYVGAMAFHSWGGATPQEYAAWANLADRINRPLLVSELGVDSAAWMTPSYFDTYHDALRELRMYQELLLYARPRGTMEWEFTSDYGMVKVGKDARGNTGYVPQSRYWFAKQFCNLTPPGAEALTTSSDRKDVLITAFRGKMGTHKVYTIHIANLGARRTAVIGRFPWLMKHLHAVRTSETESGKVLEPYAIRKRSLTVELPPQSLLTLTTAPVDDY